MINAPSTNRETTLWQEEDAWPAGRFHIVIWPDIGGLRVGHAEDIQAATGCTVVLGEGGAAGVMEHLEQQGAGFDVGVTRVSIVCGVNEHACRRDIEPQPGID